VNSMQASRHHSYNYTHHTNRIIKSHHKQNNTDLHQNISENDQPFPLETQNVYAEQMTMNYTGSQFSALEKI